jgi:hypothetical protein
LENAARNFRGELRDGGFDLAPRSRKFVRDTLFRFGDLGGGCGARFF